MATGQQEYQTQVYHASTMTVQNQFQYPVSSSPPASPPHAYSQQQSVQRSPVSPAQSASSYDGENDASIPKSATDIVRQRGANMRALALLEVEVTGQAPATAKPTSALTARQAAIARHEEKKRLARVNKEKEIFGNPEPVLIAPTKKLAETTRKVKKMTDEERGMETVADFKCQMDLDLEQQAKMKALRLLEKGFMN